MINKKYIFVTLFALCFLTFAGTLFYPFVHDDFIFIVNNPSIDDLSNVPSIFFRAASLDNVSQANPYYRPVLEILYRLQYRGFSFNPFGYHLTNLLFHFLNSILIFFLINHITKRTKLASVIAFFFAVHPVQTEAVACISGISNLFYSFFCLLSLLLYIKTFDADRVKPNWLCLAGALASYGIAVFAKEQAVIFPLVLVLYDLCFSRSRKETQASRLLGKGLFFFCALQYLLWRKTLLGTAIVPWAVINHNLNLHILNVPRILLTYVSLVVFPHNLHYYRNIDLQQPVWIASGIFLLLILCLVFLIRLVDSRNKRLIIFGLGWFLVFILPVINIIPIVIEYSFVAVFEHFLYLPMIGILLACFILLERLITKMTTPRQTRVIIPVFIVIVFLSAFFAAINQTKYWRGEIPLFSRTVKYEPNFGRAHVLLARAHVKNENCQKATPSFEKALTIFEGYRTSTKSPLLKGLYLKLIRNVQEDLSHCQQKE